MDEHKCIKCYQNIKKTFVYNLYFTYCLSFLHFSHRIGLQFSCTSPGRGAVTEAEEEEQEKMDRQRRRELSGSPRTLKRKLLSEETALCWHDMMSREREEGLCSNQDKHLINMVLP